jgi:hypothetical protein
MDDEWHKEEADHQSGDRSKPIKQHVPHDVSYTQLQAGTPSCHHSIVAEHLDFTGFQRPRQSHERINDGISVLFQCCKNGIQYQF